MNSFNYLLLSFYFIFFFEEILIDFGFIQPELTQKTSLQATFWPCTDHNTLLFSPLIFLLAGKEMKGVGDDARGAQ